jgi:methylated-DNA-[protein]-cysteine S-methyltransferase
MLSVCTERAGSVWFGVAFRQERIYATAFGPSEKSVLEGLGASLPSNIPFEHMRKTKFAEHVITVLKGLYPGKDVSQNFTFDTKRLSQYAIRIIETVCLIPPGYVTSYGEVAKAAGGSPRAVGRVMASNPFAPLCPCHRVVASDFTLGGYGGGLDVKLAFLRRESRGYSSGKTVEAGGGRLELSPVGSVLERLEKSKR